VVLSLGAFEKVKLYKAPVIFRCKARTPSSRLASRFLEMPSDKVTDLSIGEGVRPSAYYGA
jgi:hypothetical protein